MPEIHHPHLVLWGERLDPAGRSSDDGDGNAGLPALYAGYFGAWFGGLAR